MREPFTDVPIFTLRGKSLYEHPVWLDGMTFHFSSLLHLRWFYMKTSAAISGSRGQHDFFHMRRITIADYPDYNLIFIIATKISVCMHIILIVVRVVVIAQMIPTILVRCQGFPHIINTMVNYTIDVVR